MATAHKHCQAMTRMQMRPHPASLFLPGCLAICSFNQMHASSVSCRTCWATTCIPPSHSSAFAVLYTLSHCSIALLHCLSLLLQNLLGNDCAKARVNLCVAKDPSCLAFQNIIDVNGSTSAAAVGQVAPMLEQKCPISEPSVPGVKVRQQC